MQQVLNSATIEYEVCAVQRRRQWRAGAQPPWEVLAHVEDHSVENCIHQYFVGLRRGQPNIMCPAIGLEPNIEVLYQYYYG